MAEQQPSAAALAKTLACSMTAGLVAGAATNPFECLRVRWQVVALSPGGGAAAEGGLLMFAGDIVRREGLIGGLWRPGCSGWMAAVGCAFGVRMGLYEHVRLSLERSSGLPRSTATAFAAGLLMGALSNGACCPLFQAKNRLQADVLNPRGLVQELRAIVHEGGPAGLYRGVPALLLRGGLLSGGQLSGYDYSKRILVAQGLSEGPTVHVLASSVSAVTAVLASAPADIVLNRYHAAPRLGKEYSGLAAVATELVREQGVLALYKGSVPNIAKFLPLFLCSMPLYEQLRSLVGLGYLT